jgi:hypothetical protein
VPPSNPEELHFGLGGYIADVSTRFCLRSHGIGATQLFGGGSSDGCCATLMRAEKILAGWFSRGASLVFVFVFLFLDRFWFNFFLFWDGLLTLIVIIGNNYSISNESRTKNARIFFAQGCEMVPEMVSQSAAE